MPLKQDSLSRLALHYVGRYATTRHRLAGYLARKLRERGWAGESLPDIDVIVARCADLGYVDDVAFAALRAQSLTRRGFGPRRLQQTLHHAGVATQTIDAAMPDEEGALAAAEAFARRKRLGRFSDQPPSRDRDRRDFAAMLRAGHDYGVARLFVGSGATFVTDCDE